MKMFVHLIWVWKHSDIKHKSISQICLKLSRNLINYLIFGQFLTYLQNWFLLSNLISECLHTQIRCTKFFNKFLFQDKKWQRLQYCNFHQFQHIFAVARWNHPYDKYSMQWYLHKIWGLFWKYELTMILNPRFSVIVKNSADMACASVPHLHWKTWWFALQHNDT